MKAGPVFQVVVALAEAEGNWPLDDPRHSLSRHWDKLQHCVEDSPQLFALRAAVENLWRKEELSASSMATAKLKYEVAVLDLEEKASSTEVNGDLQQKMMNLLGVCEKQKKQLELLGDQVRIEIPAPVLHRRLSFSLSAANAGASRVPRQSGGEASRAAAARARQAA